MGALHDAEIEFPRLAKVADLIIKLSILLCVVFAIFCLKSFGWRPETYLPNPLSAVLYYALGTVAAFFLISLTLRMSYRISLAIILLSTVCSVYTAELFLIWSGAEFYDQTKKAARIAAARGLNFDTRYKYQVVTDLQRQGVLAVPNVNPALFLSRASDGKLRSRITINSTETLPLSGIANELTVYCNENGDFVMYESDEHGFNNPTGIWKNPRLDVAIVGDSFTQGSCVPSDKNIAGIIRKRYPATLNLGMVNNGPLAELATVKEYLPTLKHKIVFWLYYEGNDLEDLIREKQTPLLTAYLQNNSTQDLLKLQPEIDEALNAYIQAHLRAPQRSAGRNITDFIDQLKSIMKLEHSRTIVGLGSLMHDEVPDATLNLGLFQQTLIEATALVSTWNGRLYFVYLPEWLRYAHPKTASKHRNAVLTMVKSLAIPTIDMHMVFQVQSDPLALFPFRLGLHYNEDGYRLAAETLLRFISIDPSADSRVKR